MKIIVGIWSADTLSASFTASELNDRTKVFTKVVKKIRKAIEKNEIPKDQAVRGIVASPEFQYAEKDAGKMLVGPKTSAQYRALGREVDHDQKELIVTSLRELSDKNKDILLVPGTIVWKKSFNATSTKRQTNETERRQRQENHLQYFKNDSRDVFGGTRDFESTMRNLQQYSYQTKLDKITNNHQTPALEYIRNTAYVFLGGEIKYKYHKRGDAYESISNNPSVIFVPSSNTPVHNFDMGNNVTKSFGFEICADHTVAGLKNFLPSSSAAPTNDVDFHILCAASVKSYEDKMCMNEGGYFIHADATAAEKGSGSVYRKIDGKAVLKKYDQRIDFDFGPLDIYLLDLDPIKKKSWNPLKYFLS